jgi:hypothetical protein
MNEAEEAGRRERAKGNAGGVRVEREVRRSAILVKKIPTFYLSGLKVHHAL